MSDTSVGLRARSRPDVAEQARRRWRLPAMLALVGVGIVSLSAGVSSSLALFTSEDSTSGVLGTKAIFPADRVTTAFRVADASGGGAPVDASHELAFADDGRSYTSDAWATAFSAGRYLDLDLPDPLPLGLAVVDASFDLRFAASDPGATGCFHFELRRRSTGALLGSHGDSGSPVDCVTGTGLSTSSTSITADVPSTDVLDDLRIRIFARDSDASGIVIDAATVTGTTAYATWTLVPVLLVDAADGTPRSVPWGLAGS